MSASELKSYQTISLRKQRNSQRERVKVGGEGRRPTSLRCSLPNYRGPASFLHPSLTDARLRRTSRATRSGLEVGRVRRCCKNTNEVVQRKREMTADARTHASCTSNHPFSARAALVLLNQTSLSSLFELKIEIQMGAEAAANVRDTFGPLPSHSRPLSSVLLSPRPWQGCGDIWIGMGAWSFE